MWRQHISTQLRSPVRRAHSLVQALHQTRDAIDASVELAALSDRAQTRTASLAERILREESLSPLLPMHADNPLLEVHARRFNSQLETTAKLTGFARRLLKRLTQLTDAYAAGYRILDESAHLSHTADRPQQPYIIPLGRLRRRCYLNVNSPTYRHALWRLLVTGERLTHV
jgi:hypothetical protein